MGGSEGGSLANARQRFQSLSFEDEETAPAPPPEYARASRGGSQRVSSNVASPPVSPRLV